MDQNNPEWKYSLCSTAGNKYKCLCQIFLNNVPCNNGNSNITDTNKDRNKDKDEGVDARKEALETKDVMKSCWNKLISMV